MKSAFLSSTTKIRKAEIEWLFFILIPMVCLLVIYFVLPLSMVITANPKIEAAYNRQREFQEKSTVRTLSLLNSGIIRSKLQTYENIRNIILTVVENTDRTNYMRVYIDELNLSNAYEFATKVKNGVNVSNLTCSSMWFYSGAKEVYELSIENVYLLSYYLMAEPFIRSAFFNRVGVDSVYQHGNSNNSNNDEVLKSISVCLLNQEHPHSKPPLFFHFPSEYKEEYTKLDGNPMNKYFKDTLYNYEKGGLNNQYTEFTKRINNQNNQHDQPDQYELISCNVILSSSTVKKNPIGIVCLNYNIVKIVSEITKSIEIPVVTGYSHTEYYIVTPVYPSFEREGIIINDDDDNNNNESIEETTQTTTTTITEQSRPQILIRFKDTEVSNISFPTSEYLPIEEKLPTRLYFPLSSFIKPKEEKLRWFHHYQDEATCFQVPIFLSNYLREIHTVLYLLIRYEFKSSQFNTVENYMKILRTLLIPAIIVILLSTVVSLVVIRCLLNNFDKKLHECNALCEYILLGDLELEIGGDGRSGNGNENGNHSNNDDDDQQIEELLPLYKNLKIINRLHKYSSKEYFNDDNANDNNYNNLQESKRVIKFLEVLELFKQLNYPIDNVKENIGESFMKMEQNEKALHFLTLSYKCVVEKLEKEFDCSFETILFKKHHGRKQMSKLYKLYEMNLISKLFKLILLYKIMLFGREKLDIVVDGLEREEQQQEEEHLQKEHKENSNKSNKSHKNNHIINANNPKKPKNNYTIALIKHGRNELAKKELKKYYYQLKHYLSIFKKLAYPNYITGETMYAYLIEAWVFIKLKEVVKVKNILNNFSRIMTEYEFEYRTTSMTTSSSDDLKKKISQKKQNLSSHCRVPPGILWSMYYYTKAYYMLGQEVDYPEIVMLLKNSLNYKHFCEDLHFRVLGILLKITKIWGIDHRIVTGLAFFKQIIPLYHHNPATRQQPTTAASTATTDNKLLTQHRIRSLSEIKSGLEKEVLFIYDCSSKWKSLDFFRKWQKETREVSYKIYETLQPRDRISIMKVNSTVLGETCCNLVYKGENETLIEKELANSLKLKYMSGKNEIIKGFHMAIDRVRELQQEKYVVVFMRYNNETLEEVTVGRGEERLESVDGVDGYENNIINEENSALQRKVSIDFKNLNYEQPPSQSPSKQEEEFSTKLFKNRIRLEKHHHHHEHRKQSLLLLKNSFIMTEFEDTILETDENNDENSSTKFYSEEFQQSFNSFETFEIRKRNFTEYTTIGTANKQNNNNKNNKNNKNKNNKYTSSTSTSSSNFFEYYKNFKQEILLRLLDKDLFGLKVVLVSDHIDFIAKRFDLLKINSILQAQYDKREFNNNNFVYFCKMSKAKNSLDDDIERIFGKKTEKVDTKSFTPMFE